ncbi:MAG: SAM-dependent methyltransferase [Thermodesulfovibrionales bacterium]
MSLLRQKIIEKINLEGPVSFESFMEMALYYPGLGYYMKDSTRIGRGGDFYTSPHLHPIFGAMIGRQMEEMWNIMGNPGIFQVVEMGAGIGYIARDMLNYLKGSNGKGSWGEKDIFQHLEYTIVELNPFIKAEQQRLLSEFIDKVTWISSLKELKSVKGCFLSNELLDAFPVRLVEMDDELMEIYVSEDNGNFIETKRTCIDNIKDYFMQFSIEPFRDFVRGYRTEVNLRAREWLRGVSNKLSEGFVMTIDYGYPAGEYYSEERNRGTLLCYHQHQIKEDPYQNVGEQDITAHVNFSALKKWGEEAGLKTLGFCPQGTYLIAIGFAEAIKELYGDSPDVFEIAKIKGLILPQGMGESHKVMIQYKGDSNLKLKGFSLRDNTGKL